MLRLAPLIVLLGFASLSGYGQKIFQADFPEQASVMIFPVDEAEDADLWVCFVWEEEELTRTGLWMDMRFDYEADIIVFFVDDEEESNLKIWLVDTPEESKWLNESKKSLLLNKRKE
ncbi:MAG: DUF6150 family protein [Bacteroidales bacterium]|nr:DUF6150 family protein [Bacteroidales bacterium]MDD3891687.1 DUF6150 family protein [Bacteroidales bacterium]